MAGPAAEVDGVDKVVRLVDVVQAVHQAARHLLVQVGVVLVVGRERGALSVVRLELPVEDPRGEATVPAADDGATTDALTMIDAADTSSVMSAAVRSFNLLSKSHSATSLASSSRVGAALVALRLKLPCPWEW